MRAIFGRLSLSLFLFTTAGSQLLGAETFFIDFDSGNNQSDGLTAQTAWKHAPFDPQAQGRPASTELSPGDVLRFKGGVAYHGSLVIDESGAAEAPIVLDGNNDGSWGDGPAILDGGGVIGGWEPVSSAADVGGNPLWQRIYTTEIDANIHPNVTHGEVVLHRKEKTGRQAPWQRVILIDGETGLLPIAQYPKPADPFFPDLPADFLKTNQPIEIDPQAERTRIHDSNSLGPSAPPDLAGAFAGFHAGNNHVYFGRILQHDPDAGLIELPLYQGYTYDNTKFALYNAASLIENSGEWTIQPLGPGRARLFLLPPAGDDATLSNIAYPELKTGVSIVGAASHIRIKGFLIQRYAGGEGGITVARSSQRSRDIGIENCEIRSLTGMAGVMLNHCDAITVRNCHIHHNPGWTVGIFLNRVSHYEVSDNLLRKNSGSGIRHYECTDGRILNNRLIDHHGIHSSGINLYEGSRDILLEGNYLTDIIAINRSAERIQFRNNIVDLQDRDGFCVAIWRSGSVGGRHIKDLVFEHNTFIRAGYHALTIQTHEGTPTPRGLVLRNNLIAQTVNLPADTVLEGNLYLQQPRGNSLGESDRIADSLGSVLRAPHAGDYRRVSGSPLAQAGASLERTDTH